MNTSGKYIDLWVNYKTLIKDKLENCRFRQSIQLSRDNFEKVGNRKKYSFNLEYENGIVVNNIDGSAVARDLAKVLEQSNDILRILKTGHFKIRMDSSFTLWLERK